MKALNIITMVLVLVGALNWGLVGLAGLDLVALIFGPMSILSRIVYVLVGLSAVGQVAIFASHQSHHETPAHA